MGTAENKVPARGYMTDYDEGRIVALRREITPLRQMLRELGRSVLAKHILKRNEKERDPQTHKNSRKSTLEQMPHLMREASIGEKSSFELQKSLHLKIGVRWVQQLLRGMPHLKYRKT